MGKSLLLISENDDDQAFATEVISVAGATLLRARNAEEGAAIIANTEVAIVFVDVSSEAQYRAFEAAIQKSVGLFSDRISPQHFSGVIFISRLAQNPQVAGRHN